MPMMHAPYAYAPPAMAPAPGIAPAEGDWQTVKTGSNITGTTTDLGELDPRDSKVTVTPNGKDF